MLNGNINIYVAQKEQRRKFKSIFVEDRVQKERYFECFTYSRPKRLMVSFWNGHKRIGKQSHSPGQMGNVLESGPPFAVSSSRRIPSGVNQ